MTLALSRTAGRRAPAAPATKAQALRSQRRAAFWFLLPDTLGLLVFVAIPMLLSVLLGFFAVDGFGNISFAGVDNYVRMGSDPQFWRSVQITLTYLVVLVPLLYVVGLALALLVQQRIPLVGLIRSMLFVPYVISLVVVALVWEFILGERTGVLAQLLAALGIEGVSFLGDPTLALGTVIVVTLWFQMGYYMIIFLAGLQDIPGEYYEAARIDGASAWQRLLLITMPLLRPTSFFVIVTATVSVITGGLDLIFVLTGGGPAGSTSLLIYFVYEQAFLFGDLGYAAAIGSVLTLVLLAWTGLMFAVTRGGRFDHDS
ncbi:carbohydrate ABC transporter permease [Pseudactinotalea suaedae]|jgi:multiple sugar transport system permease protein|uniref:carbohydrate ABC transporter permease n=1 Tax=Pseudactinotalea suaedae TaxID=1524924 RepID=UPI0012E17716|nr:sugar ABC transporter permease [Pseudactinotalea suaedae]